MLAIYCRGMGLRNLKAHVHPKVIESTVRAGETGITLSGNLML